MSVFGAMAAWPDPQDLPIQATWNMSEAEAAASPLAVFRAGAVDQCRAWREAAAADGWSVGPTYPGHEAVETAWTADRDGYKVQGLARPVGHCGSRLPVATLSIWGPDGLAIKPPPVYSFAAIVAGAQTCHRCGAYPVPTERVAFVGRYCATCAPGERLAQERPGWCE